jgi:hypothetical protein
LAACLVSLAGVLGCGGGVTPEQREAMAHLQDRGGKINVKSGGYEVDLRNTLVEDDDLVHVKKIPHLKSIDLRSTRITDAGLKHLYGIDTLEFVGLQSTDCTPEGAKALAAALPKADILRYPRPAVYSPPSSACRSPFKYQRCRRGKVCRLAGQKPPASAKYMACVMCR